MGGLHHGFTFRAISDCQQLLTHGEVVEDMMPARGMTSKVRRLRNVAVCRTLTRTQTKAFMDAVVTSLSLV